MECFSCSLCLWIKDLLAPWKWKFTLCLFRIPLLCLWRRTCFPGLARSVSAAFLCKSQNHSMVGAGRALCGSPSPAPCPSRVTQSRLHSTAARGAGISPEKETPQPPWAAWARALSPSEGRSSSSGSAGASSAPVCACCPLSCRWAPLQRVWPRPPDPHPADI